jgi:hypothetical protein
MTALARASRNRKRQIHPLVGDDAPHLQTRICVTITKILSWAPVIDPNPVCSHLTYDSIKTSFDAVSSGAFGIMLERLN